MLPTVPHRGRLCLVLAMLMLALVPTAAQAANSPTIALAQTSGTVLFGTNETVTLTASNPSGQPWGYNLTDEAVLPVGVTYVSTAAGAPTPTVLANQPSAGRTTLIWTNISDLSPNSSQALSFTVSHSTTTLGPGSTYTITSGAYVNTDPRFLPKFDATGAPTAGSFTGSATQTATSTITAIKLTQAEPSPEGKLLRGIHDHRTIYTATVTNNQVKATNAITVDEWLPAGLEWMACGTGDNTTDAPTNAGSPLEYPGAPVLNASGAPAGLSGCIAATSAVTVSADPDGAGPLPTAVYTHVVYTIGNLAAGAVRSLSFVAAVPIRENTLDFNGAAAGNGTAPATAAGQANDLDNNSGAETFNGQGLSVYGVANGTYNGVTAVSDTNTLTRTAQDVRVLKSVSTPSINQGQDSTWTLDVSTSEYRYVPTITVTDTVPNGLCPVDNGGPSLTDAQCRGNAADVPSLAWDSAVENSNGTWSVQWTIPRRMEPSDDFVITFHTHTRDHYRSAGADTTPVYTNDGWTNNVAISGADFRRCVAPNVDCIAGGTKINGDEVDGIADLDSSSASQTASGPTLDKTIQNSTAKLVNCTTGTYTNTAPVSFPVGSKVCYRLQLTFPGALDTRNAQVTDFLPPGTTYVAGSAATMPANTAPILSTTVNGNTVTWVLGTTGDVTPGRTFDAVVASTIDQSATARDGDITANLMKVSYANTAGTSFSLRDEIDTTLSQPQVDLLKGVRTVNGDAARAANTDGVTVPGAAAVQYRVDVENKGSLAASAAEVWDRLPAQLKCAQVSAASISNGGTCVTDATNGDYVRWTALALGARTTVALGTQLTLTYIATLPGTLSPATTLTSSAGVRTFQSVDGQGDTLTWFPQTNVDPSVAAATTNAPAAADPTSITINGATLAHTDTTAVNETGNTTAGQATIGEAVSYATTATIPDGTTLYTPVLTIPIPAQLTYNGGLIATINGVNVTTVGWTATQAGANVTITGPATYVNAAGSGADVLAVAFNTFVAQAAANTRLAAAIADTATLSYKDAAAGVHTLSQAAPTISVVEPLITTTLAHVPASASVLPDQDIQYTVTTANSNAARVSIAHDTTTTVTVPLGLTPYTAAGGVAVANGATIGGGVWNSGTRTIVFPDGNIAPNASSAHSFFLHVDDPATSGSTFTVSAEGDTTSMAGTPGAPAVERTALTTPNTGYKSTATNLVTIAAPLITKAVDRATATIGEQATYTLAVTLEANINYFDVTVRDVLPANLVWDGMIDSSCTSGCASPGAITATALPQSGQTTGYWIGDVPSSPSLRTITIHYHAHVGPAAVEGNSLVNTATAYDDITNRIGGVPASIPAPGSFDQASTPATATMTVHEPAPVITKTVSGNDASGRIAPGDVATYTLAVKNNGLAPMDNIHVTDVPDADLVAVTPTTGAANVTTAWTTPGSTIAWDIAGPIAPGATVNLAYTAHLAASATLHQGQTVDNNAKITAAFGLDATTRTVTHPGFTYKSYANGPTLVHLTTDMPTVSIVQTTAAAGFPDSAPAQLHTPFGWRVVVTNTSAGAPADALNVSDVLPADWVYVPGSAQLGGVSIGDPTTIAGQTLTWANLIAVLPAGAAQTLTFQATPSTAAALNKGVGAANPHIANASVTFKDATGASSDADGPYAAGPDPAQAILANPVADIATHVTVNKPTAIEGDPLLYTVHVTNAGPSDALNVVSTTTIATGETITSVPAGCTQVGQAITCSWTSIPTGGDNSYVIGVQVNPAPPATLAVPTSASTTSTDPTHGDWTDNVAVTTQHPHVSIAKAASGQSGPGAHAAPGDTPTYTLTVTNSGTSDAYDVTVTDLPDAALTAIVDTTNAADATKTWTAGDHHLGWTIPHITAGSSVTLAYTSALVSGTLLHDAQSVDNTAAATHYFAVSSATRIGNPGFGWTDFTDGGIGTAHLVTDVPTVSLVQTTTAAGFPDSAAAQVHTPFGWRIVVTNTSVGASATALNIADVIPADWVYVPGSAQLGGVAIGDPTTIAGQTLTWANVVATLPAGASRTLTFQATPSTAAALNRGVGPANPHIASASATFKDAGGASADADGPYTAGPDPAQAILDIPPADIATHITVNHPTAVEGDPLLYTVHVINAGPSDALNVSSTTTIPAGETITSVPAGCSQAGQAITCTWSSMINGADNSYVIGVQVKAAPPATITVPTSASTTSTDPTHGDWNDSVPVTTQHPKVSIVKAVAGTDIAGHIAPGDTATYSLTVSNTGSSDAYDVAVTDLPDPALTAVADTTNAADATKTWTAGDHHLGWTVPHISAGSSVTLAYTAQLVASAGLHDGQSVDNTAAAPHYFAVSSATRIGNPGFGWTDFTDGGSSAVHLTTDTPAVGIVQTTTAAGFPDSAAAQIHTSFGWRIVVTGTSLADPADHLNIADVLPADWSFDAGSAKLGGVAIADPAIAGQTLTWADVIAALPAGASRTLTFTATPSSAAAVNRGVGAANPHIANASVTYKDATGATADADRTYAAGPDPAQAILDVPPADIATHITVNHPTAVEGDPLTYTVHVVNAGPSDALNVVSTTTIPASETITSVPAGCSQAGQAITCTWSSMLSGADNSYVIGVQVKPAPPATLTVPTAASTTSTDPTHVDWNDSVSVTSQHPHVTITKAVSGQSGPGVRVQPDDIPAYTLTVRNTGTSDAYDVAVTDLPDGALIAIVDTTNAADATKTWTAGDHHLGWTIPHIAAGSSVTLAYTSAVVSGTLLHDGEAIDNVAAAPDYFAASSATRIGNPGFGWTDFTDGGSASAHLSVDLPVLAITDTTGAAGFPETADARIGVPFAWHLTATNTSIGATAQTAHMTDTLPADWSYVPGSAKINGAAAPDPVISGQTLTFDLGSLSAGATDTIDFTATPSTAARTDAQPHVNGAQATWTDASDADHSADGPYATANDPASATLRFPILSVSKTAATPTVNAGAGTSYTITVTNSGDAPADNVAVADTLPAGLAYHAGDATASPAAGFSETDATVPSIAWKVVKLDPTRSVTITVPVTLAASLDAGLVLHNTVSVTSDERPDPVTDAADITTSRSTDVSIVKTGPAAAKAGTDVTWALAIHNAGPSDARGVVVSDPLPDHTTFVAADAPCYDNAGTVTCALGTLVPGQDVTLNVTGHIASNTSADVVNTASVSTTTPDTDPTNDSSSETVGIGNAVDLAITKTAQTPHVVQGFNETFILTVSDAGPSDAHGTEVVDTLPAGLSFVSVAPRQGTCTDAGQVITCQVGDVSIGNPVNIIVVARGDVAGSQTNHATVSTQLQTDLDPTNDDADATVIVDPVTNLNVTKTGPAQVAPGAQATYTMVAGNAGPSPATGVVLSDQLPAGVTFASGSPDCTLAGSVVSCPVGDLAVGGSATRTVTVTVAVSAASSSLQDTAAVTGNEADLDLRDNNASVTTTVGQSADVRIAKHQTKLDAGGEVTYGIDVVNNGPSDAAAVVVSDPLPKGLTFISAKATQGSCSAQGATVTCALGTIVDGGAASIDVIAKIDRKGAGRTIANTAHVTTTTPDPDPSNDVSAVKGTVASGTGPASDLKLTKTASVATPKLGESFVYTIAVVNNGTGAATGMVVTDPVPSELKVGTIHSSQGTCAADGLLVRCPLGSLAAGATAKITIAATPLRIGDFSNTALVVADGAPTKTKLDAASVVVKAKPGRGTLTLTKRALHRHIKAGAIATYRIAVTAHHARVAKVRVCDRLPHGMVFVSVHGGRLSHGQACWTIASLGAGHHKTFMLTARSELSSHGTLRNTATAKAPHVRSATAHASVSVSPSRRTSTAGGGVTG